MPTAAQWAALDNNKSNPYGFANPNSSLSQSLQTPQPMSADAASAAVNSSYNTPRPNMPDVSSFSKGSDNAYHGVMSDQQIKDLQNSRFMGNQYKPDSYGYMSTNPSNPYAARYTSGGQTVASIGYGNQQTGVKFEGYGTPAMSGAIVGATGNPAGQDNMINNGIASGQLKPLSSGQAMTPTPFSGTGKEPMYGLQTPQVYRGGSNSAATGMNIGGGLQKLPYDPSKPATFDKSPYDPSQGMNISLLNSSTAQATPTPSGGIAPALTGLRWNPNASYQDRLARFSTNKNDAQNELLSLKQLYDQAQGNPARQAEINGWANQVRQASGISVDDPYYGNSSAIDPNTQQQYTDSLLGTNRSGKIDTGTPTPTPTTGTNPGGPTPTPSGGIAPGTNWGTTPAQAAQSATEQAQARIDKMLAAGKNAWQTGITGAKNAFDYTNQIQGDRRALENTAFQRDNSPFSGHSDYLAADLARTRQIADTASNADYKNKTDQLNQTWADLQSAAPEQQQALYDQLYQQAAALGIQADQLNATIQNNKFNQGIAQAGVTGQYTNPQTGQTQQTQQAQQNQFTQQHTLRQEHIDLANALSQAYGINVYPTEDPAEAFKQVEGKTPINMQQLELAKQSAEALNKQREADARKYDAQATNSNNIANRQATAAEKSQHHQDQLRLIDIWKIQGKAPAGIDGVQENTPYTGQDKPQPTKTPNAYKTDPNFAQDVAHMKANPSDAKALDTNPQPFIDAYGMDGYKELRKQAGLD